MGYELIFTKRFLKDFDHWSKVNVEVMRKVSDLVKSIQITPRFGIGRPERLKHVGAAEVWSRRIDREHRIVYEIEGSRIVLIQARFHYQ